MHVQYLPSLIIKRKSTFVASSSCGRKMDFLQKLRCNLLATAGVNLFKYVLFYWTENTNVSVFFVPTPENVGARALSDLNSNSWV